MTAAPVPWHHPIVITRHDDEAGPYITLSTPLPDHTLVSDELLHLTAVEPHSELIGVHLTPPIEGNPDVALHQAGHDRGDVDCLPPIRCWYGWQLHLQGRNISATYRIDSYYSHGSNTWRATRWPD